MTDGYPLPAGEEVLVPIEDPSKVYVVATPASNCQQTVGITGQIVGDTFTLTFRGATTASIPVNANAATVQAALVALGTIGTGNCTVADTGGSQPFTVTFTGALAKQNVDLMTSVGGGANEKQKIDVSAAIAGDKILFSYDGTPASDWVLVDNDAEAIQGYLETIPALEGNVSVTGDPENGFIVEYIGDLALTDIADDKITALCGKNEEFMLTVSSMATDDLMYITFGEATSGELICPVTGADIQTAMTRPGYGFNEGDLLVHGNGPYVFELTGTDARQDFDVTGHATCGKNEVQKVTLTSPVAGDKVVLTCSGVPSDSFSYNANAGTVEEALQSIPLLNGCVDVSAGDPSGWVIEFGGDLDRTDVATLAGTYGANEKQLVTVTDGASGDELSLTYVVRRSANFAYNDTSANVQTALEGIAALTGNVTVEDGDPAGWVIEFKGTLAGQHVADLTGVCGKNAKDTIGIPNSVDTGKFTVTYGGVESSQINYNADHAAVLTGLETIPALVGKVSVAGGPGPSVDWVVEFVGTLARQDVHLSSATSHCGNNEKQTVTLTNVTGGNFTLSYGGTPTANIGYADPAATVETKLAAIGALTGNVHVTGASPVWTVEFINALGLGDGALLLVATDVDLEGADHSVDVAQLVDGTTATVSVASSQAGHAATVNVVETVEGHSAAVTVSEVVKGANRTVTFEKTTVGHDATVVVTETQKGNATCAVTIAKVADITAGSQYSWLAC